MSHKDIEDTDIILLVQSIENDYGMDCKLWPENDVRLKNLHEWYIKHSDEKKSNLPCKDIQKIQKALDEQMPKKTICEIFGIGKGKLAYDIERGFLSDVKWKNG